MGLLSELSNKLLGSLWTLLRMARGAHEQVRPKLFYKNYKFGHANVYYMPMYHQICYIKIRIQDLGKRKRKRGKKKKKRDKIHLFNKLSPSRQGITAGGVVAPWF